MLQKVFDYFNDILLGRLRASQMFVLLLTVLATGAIYSSFRNTTWFQAMRQDFGSAGPVIAIVAVFLVSLVVFQLFALFVGQIQQSVRQEQIQAQKRDDVVNLFNRLSDWQRDFLLRAIRQNKRQWQSYEMPSGYACIWEPEMSVLMQMRIVRQNFRSVYLIDDDFFDTLQSAYNADVAQQNDS